MVLSMLSIWVYRSDKGFGDAIGIDAVREAIQP